MIDLDSASATSESDYGPVCAVGRAQQDIFLFRPQQASKDLLCKDKRVIHLPLHSHMTLLPQPLLRPCIFLCTNLWNRIEGSERNLCEVLALCDSLYPYSQGARRHLCTQRSAETSSLQGPVTDFLLTSPLTTSISKKLSSSKQILLFPLES